MPGGYNYFTATKYPPKIDFYKFPGYNGTGNVISYDISEYGEYKEIFGFFGKYEYIYFIHSIDPGDGAYSDENITALFRVQTIVSDFDADYIPWAEIRRNRTGGEIRE